MTKISTFYNSLTLPEKIALRAMVNQDDFLDHPEQYLIPTWIKANEEFITGKLTKALMYLYEEKGIKYVNDISLDELKRVKNAGSKTWTEFDCLKHNYELEKRRAKQNLYPSID